MTQESSYSNAAPAPSAPDPDPRRLLTRSEVAELFGLSHRWLEVAASRGDGPPMVRITRRLVRYRLRDVEDWIDAHVDPHGGVDAR